MATNSELLQSIMAAAGRLQEHNLDEQAEIKDDLGVADTVLWGVVELLEED